MNSIRSDLVITATAVGAPGFANWAIRPRDAINAARRLVERMDRPPRGVICGHVPGFNAWLVGAALGLDYVDLASNGRGHPTVKMGGMGLGFTARTLHHTDRGERFSGRCE